MTQTYSYKPKYWLLLLCMALCGPGAWYFGDIAYTNDRGLILSYGKSGYLEFPFTQTEATVLYWAICMLFLFIVIVCILAIFRTITSEGKLLLTDEGITAPTGVFAREKTVSVLYKDIKGLELQTVHGIRYIKIIHNGGKFYVNDNMLSQKSYFDDILNTLMKHRHLP